MRRATVEMVTQHDGSVLRLRKLADRLRSRPTGTAHGPPAGRTRRAARSSPACCYVDPTPQDLHDHLDTVPTPLNQLTDEELTPGAAALAAMNASLR